MIHTQRFAIHEVANYINWLYFFHAWSFPSHYGSVCRVHNCVACRQQWVNSFPASERDRATEAVKLYDDAQAMLRRWDGEGRMTAFRVRLLQAFADGDDILLPEADKRLPMLRQQQPLDGQYCLCLADFIRPLSQGIPDRIGIFASTVDEELETLYPEDDYHHLLAQTLADRLAEATAERGHELTRQEWWGYASDEHFSPEELFQEKYQGKRPAVGYPSLPDQSLNFLIDELIGFHSLGIALTEHGAMKPHGSTSGLMLAHPKARHFRVGKVGEDQLADYALRRGLPVDYLRPFLSQV